MKAYIENQDYQMQLVQANGELRKYISQTKENLNKLAQELDRLEPEIEFTNEKEIQIWYDLIRAIRKFNDLEVEYVIKLKPKVQESILNLYGTKTDLAVTNLVNEILQQAIDQDCGKFKN